MNLKRLRKRIGLTQKEASIITSIPLRTYKRIESLKRLPDKYNYVITKLKTTNTQKEGTNKDTKVTVIGAGYVGLSNAVILSRKVHVDVLDIDIEKINKINARIAPYNDKELIEIFKNEKLDLLALNNENYDFSHSDYVIISLPTNYKEELKSYDMSLITNTIKEIRKDNKSSLIIIKSTCSVGYTSSLNDKNIIFVPEFLVEVEALKGAMYPSRIIIGADTINNKVKKFVSLERNASLNRSEVIYMSSKEAEATKLFSNTYLAMRVAFFNELDSFALQNNLNTSKIIEGVSLDNRIGDYYNNPSFGFGGYCLPKDSKTLSNLSKDNNELLTSINNSNSSRKRLIALDIISKAKEISKKENVIVGIYSLNNKKEGTNRNSPIYDIINILKEEKINTVYYSNNDLEDFINNVDIVITNRMNDELLKYKNKVYTRDIYSIN